MTEDIVVVDDFLTPSYHGLLQEVLLSLQVDWKYHGNITYHDEAGGETDFGFAHRILHEDEDGPRETRLAYLVIPLLLQILDFGGFERVIRSRVDLTVLHPGGPMHEPHIDLTEPHYSSVYYVNDCDGATRIFNERTLDRSNFPAELTVKQDIEPRANRLLLFKGDHIHTGHSPKKSKARVLINANFE